MVYPETGEFYECQWDKDLKEGVGYYFEPNGKIYCGQYRQDVEEGVGEEVPVVWLPSNTPHGNKVSGVNSISQEFESHSWSKWGLAISSWSSSRGQSNESLVSSVEDSTILVGFGNKLNLSNGSDRVDILSSVSV